MTTLQAFAIGAVIYCVGHGLDVWSSIVGARLGLIEEREWCRDRQRRFVAWKGILAKLSPLSVLWLLVLTRDPFVPIVICSVLALPGVMAYWGNRAQIRKVQGG